MEQRTPRPLAGAVILAAGSASRMQGINKQLLELAGVPVVIRSLQAFDQNEWFQWLVLVAPKEHQPQMAALVEQYRLCKPVTVVSGGATRQESALRGVQALPDCVEYVAIHDGARPFVSQQVLDACLQDAIQWGASCASIPVKDTIKQVDDRGVVSHTPPRERLRAAQTPQIFLRQEYLLSLIHI